MSRPTDRTHETSPPQHPRLAAGLLMLAVVAFLVLVATLGVLGR